MKLFMLVSQQVVASDSKYRFDTFSHLGTWKDDRSCVDCGQSLARLVPPLIVEWDGYGVEVGDLAYCGYTVIAKRSAAELIGKCGLDFLTHRVLVADRTGGNRIENSKAKSRFKWIEPKHQIPLLPDESNVRVVRSCATCGKTDWSFAREGIVVRDRDRNGLNAFRIEQLDPSGAIVVTEEGLEILKKLQLANLGFRECGRVITRS
jgi:hypothetical protein